MMVVGVSQDEQNKNPKIDLLTKETLATQAESKKRKGGDERITVSKVRKMIEPLLRESPSSKKDKEEISDSDSSNSSPKSGGVTDDIGLDGQIPQPSPSFSPSPILSGNNSPLRVINTSFTQEQSQMEQ